MTLADNVASLNAKLDALTVLAQDIKDHPAAANVDFTPVLGAIKDVRDQLEPTPVPTPSPTPAPTPAP